MSASAATDGPRIRVPRQLLEELEMAARFRTDQRWSLLYRVLWRVAQGADPLLIAEAGRYADRLSVNIELPTETSLIRLAPEKQVLTIKQAMHTIHQGEAEASTE